ncbi:MAG: prephenate dehydratase [Planctomycetes bacterium]|jgi:chorismate mutase/prephenate dehydratase|nr:prephenate dehydratase [Planctomycetota bacterium]
MSLDELRKKIDAIDEKLVELINERAQIVIEIGKLKQSSAAPIYVPHREKAVFDKIAELNKGPLPDKALTAIWREIMSGSFFLERPLRIGYLGPKGSFSHNAAILKFGQSVDYEALADIRGIFEEVSKGHCDFGIVPVENSAGGGVRESLDAFIETDVMVCAEANMAIHHHLMATCPMRDIERIYSQPEVFAQCRNWLAATFKDAQLIPVASSSRAAQLAAEEKGSAAIASAIAAEIYGLKILCPDIEDISNNITRFLIISKQDAQPSGDDKTIILFSTAHRTGALVDVLNVFKEYNLNMTNIGSRPNRKREWEYYFFVDFLGHRLDENVQQALQQAKAHCLQLSVLGSFPRSTTVM